MSTAAERKKKRVKTLLGEDAEDKKLQDLRFWKAAEPHLAVFSNAERLGNYARARQVQDLHFACLYDDSELAAMIMGADALEEGIPQSMTTNIVRRQVDWFVAQSLKNKAVPMALTEGGNFGAQRRAKALSKFFGGVLESVGYYDTLELRIRDAAIFGDGLARNYRVGKKLHHDRLLPWQIRHDPIDGLMGKPRSIYIEHTLDKLVAIERYPKFAEQLKAAEGRTAADAWDIELERTADVVKLIEAIHLPNGEPTESNAKDGAWVMCASNATVARGEYRRDYHMISKLDCSPAVFGWRGEGLVRQLAGLQYEVNSVGLRLQEQGFMTGSYVLLPDGSSIDTETLDNGALTLIRYTGQKPEWVAPPPWHPQFFDYFLKIRGQFASDVIGSTGASRGEGPPPGVTSGRAQRTFHEIAQENLVPFGKRVERDCVDTAWQLFDLMEEIHDERGESDESFKVRVEQNKHARYSTLDVNYDDVRIDRAEFTLRCFPTNFLASTPSDRWEQVSEMAEKGLFSQDELVSLLDFPDVKRVMNLRGSPREAVEAIIEHFLESKNPKPVKPEPTMNLDIVVALGTLAYLEAKWIDKAPEKNTAALLEFVLSARAMRDGDDQPVEEGEAVANGGAGPQPGDQGLDAPIDEAMPALGDQGPLFAPPDGAPLPANAVAPENMPPPGGVVQ